MYRALFPISQLVLASLIIIACGCGGSTTTHVSGAIAPTPTPQASPNPAAPPNATQVSKIQSLPGWQFCTKKLNGGVCASGAGNAVSAIHQHQTSPATDGDSSEFTISGPTGYSNALWWNSFPPNSNVTHFTYDLWFYVDRPQVSQALEFDVNQSFGGIRYTWGSECNFNGTHKWDIWDPAGFKWVPTGVACRPFSPNAWHHLVWQLERANHQVHYISLTVDNQQSSVDIYKDPQTNWNFEDINVAFQLDGDSRQDPYNVWLDQVSLTMW